MENDDTVSDGNETTLFTIKLVPSNADGKRQLLSGGIGSVILTDDTGTEYIAVMSGVSVDDSVTPPVVIGNEFVFQGALDVEASRFTLSVDHFGKIIGPWEYTLSS